MRTHKLLANMKAGRKTSLCQLSFPFATRMELMGLAGLDGVIFDGERGTFTPESLDDRCRVAESVGLTPMVCVPDLGPVLQ